MRGTLFFWRRYRGRLLTGFAAPALLTLTGAADVAPAENGKAAANGTVANVTPAAPAAPLTMEACRQIALHQQPAIAAARASLAAAVARSQAVGNLRVPRCLARDLPIRCQQAALGVTIAQAGVTVAERDTVYGVNYSYLTALYARQQMQVADQARKDLRELQDLAQAAVNAGARDVTTRHVERVGIYLRVAAGRREEAVEGVQRALGALREAMGVAPDYPIQLAADEMPWLSQAVDRDQVIALALAQRSEIAQAATAAQAAGLEVSAQEAKRLPTQRTFAAGSDIHAQPLPAGSYDENYHPAAVGPEMPTMIVGSREDRAEQARAYNARAGAVVDKTRNLIALEADQAYWKWLEASRKLPDYRKAAEGAEKISRDLRATFDPRNPRVSIDELLNAGVLSSQLRVQANQAQYQLLLALAQLERVTGGAFCAGLEVQASPPKEANGNREAPNNGDKAVR